MLLPYLLAAASAASSSVVGPQPGVTGLSLAVSGGSCVYPNGPLNPGSVGVSGKNTLSWTITNPNDVAYAVNVSNNGILLATLLTSTTSYVDDTGAVLGNSVNPVVRNDRYEVAVVRKVDAVVVQTSVVTASGTYGTCG